MYIFLMQDVGVTVFFQIFLAIEEACSSTRAEKFQQLVFQNYNYEQRDFINRMNMILLRLTKKSELRRRMFSVKDSKGNMLSGDKARLTYDLQLRQCMMDN